MTDERCSDCYYWDSKHKRVEQGKVISACLYDTPTMFFDRGNIIAAWPQTREDRMCGKFKAIRMAPTNERNE